MTPGWVTLSTEASQWSVLQVNRFLDRASNLILTVDGDHGDPVFMLHLGVNLDVTADNDDVIWLAKPRCSTVDADFSRALFDWNDVSLPALSIRYVVDVDLLKRQKIRRFNQGLVERDAPFVIKIGAGDASTMKFGFEKRTQHWGRRGFPQMLADMITKRCIVPDSA